MKLVIISDTHSRHHQLDPLPEGDVLIHCGDGTNRGTVAETLDFLEWLSAAGGGYAARLLVPGNHDQAFADENVAEMLWAAVALGITPLIDSGVVIDGIHFYGSPWVQARYHMAFTKPEGDETLRARRNEIPDDVDVLITHGPPSGILDETLDGHHPGCVALASRLQRIAPRLHCFGHIHESRGQVEIGGTTFLNAACAEVGSEILRPASIFKLDSRDGFRG